MNGIYPYNIYPYNVQHYKPEKPAENDDSQKKEVSYVYPEKNEMQDHQSPSKGKNQAVEQPLEKVNISRIVADFKKTLATIGAPEEINEEVNSYLKLAESQSQKEKPSEKVIRSNLMSASNILDTFITETLKKPSKVVTNWIDALLLQKIDFKSDSTPAVKEVKPSEVKPRQPVETEIQQQVITQETKPKLSPEEIQLRKLYKQVEKLTDAGEYSKAIDNYDKILPLAVKNRSFQVEERIYMDKAYIYDVKNDLPKALNHYNKAVNVSLKTGNQKLRALAHYNIASIYDDLGKTEPAMEHYYEALGLDGQVENMKAQTLTLNDVGVLLTSKRDYQRALDHYQVGYSLTDETKDLKGRAFILGNVGNLYRETGKDNKALKYYKESIKYDTRVLNYSGCSRSYESAADIMLKKNFAQKAKNLYQRSLEAAEKAGDNELSTRILEKLQTTSISI